MITPRDLMDVESGKRHTIYKRVFEKMPEAQRAHVNRFAGRLMEQGLSRLHALDVIVAVAKAV